MTEKQKEKALGWKKKRTSNALVPNADLWRRIDELIQVHQVTTTWPKGHTENERCDQPRRRRIA